jgi:hypothetical protein
MSQKVIKGPHEPIYSKALHQRSYGNSTESILTPPFYLDSDR